jgi:secreted trypsin-like serine protease
MKATMIAFLSGGPLMMYNTESDVPYWLAIGITSYGFSKCGSAGLPGVYTRVSSFLEWIATNIRY